MPDQFTLKTVKSRLIHIGDNEQMNAHIQSFANAKAVAWYFDALVFYSIRNGVWNEPLRDSSEWVRLRLFDQDRELHCWRSGDQIKGRLRDDSGGEELSYLPASLLLNGTTLEPTGSGILATEKKGIRYNLPYEEFRQQLSGGGERIFLEIRNYVGYNDIGQAGITDCRFVNFHVKKQ